MTPTPRFTARLVTRTPLSSRVHRLKFATQPSALHWAAGQYVVMVRVAGVEQALFLPYSIASAHDPQKPGEFELAVAFGAGADAIDALTVGAKVELEGPSGDFTWQPSPSPAALLVGVGTGVAPLRALIEEELARDSQIRLLLIAGHRLPEDVLFATDFAELAQRHARFRFLPTLTGLATRAHERATAWPGEQGRVQTQLRSAVLSLGSLDAYVCGRLDMVQEVVLALVKEGVPKDRIRSEGF